VQTAEISIKNEKNEDLVHLEVCKPAVIAEPVILASSVQSAVGDPGQKSSYWLNIQIDVPTSSRPHVPHDFYARWELINAGTNLSIL
jgi:hypothetical protein